MAAESRWLTRQEVEEYAERLGIGVWHTVWRYMKAGLVHERRRVRGVGRAPAYEYPPAVTADLDWVGAQLDAARKEARRTPSRALLVHRRWWEAGDPDYFEPWRRDRVWNLWCECQGWLERRRLSPEAVAGQADDLASAWGRQRGWLYRSMMRGEGRREAFTSALVPLYLGRPGDVRLGSDALDEVRMAGEPGWTPVGQVLEQGFRFDHFRDKHPDVAIPGKPGECLRDLLATVPHPDGQLWVLARLTAAEAARLREAVIAIDAVAREAGTRVLIGDLWDKPEVAGMLVATGGAWGWDVMDGPGPPEPEACPACGVEVPKLAAQRLALCPGCGTWLVNGVMAEPTS